MQISGDIDGTNQLRMANTAGVVSLQDRVESYVERNMLIREEDSI